MGFSCDALYVFDVNSAVISVSFWTRGTLCYAVVLLGGEQCGRVYSQALPIEGGSRTWIFDRKTQVSDRGKGLFLDTKVTRLQSSSARWPALLGRCLRTHRTLATRPTLSGEPTIGGMSRRLAGIQLAGRRPGVEPRVTPGGLMKDGPELLVRCAIGAPTVGEEAGQGDMPAR